MEIKVPELGESITEGTIAKWLVKEGERVQRGDVLVEVETDKVNMEIPANEDGVLGEILRREGETVKIGEAIAVLTQGGVSPATTNVDVTRVSTLNDTGEDRTKGTTGAGQMTPSDVAPSGEEHKLQDGNNVAASTQQMKSASYEQRVNHSAPVSPSLRRLARERGVDVATLTNRSLASEGDASRAASVPSEASAASAASASGAPNVAHASSTSAVPAEYKPVERVRMSRRRQTIAKRLVEAQQTAAMLTTFNEVDMTAVMAIRNRRKEAFQTKHGVKLGFMSFFTKAVVGALKQFPLLNAEIDGQDVLIKKHYDIGIAVSTEEGLVVPVMRDADRLSFGEMEQNIAELADKARHNRLKIADITGGTFTITNGGVFGSLLSTPIINPPQVGILGMHTIQTRPVTVDGDGIENRPMMYIALSYDHRIVDGKEAVSFLVKVKQLLEDPESLMFDV